MLGCNLPMLQVFGVEDLNQVMGKTSYQIMDPAFYPLINNVKKADDYVMQTRTELILLEQGINTLGQDTVYLSKKAPLLIIICKHIKMYLKRVLMD